MISELFNAPFNKYADDRIELQQIEEMSPVSKNPSFLQNLTESAKLRLEKLHKLPHQMQSLIEALVPQNYKEELMSFRDSQFLRVKNTRDMFFGETSICQSANMFSRQKCKVAQGLCEIFFENQSYLIGFFQNGRLQKSFIWILQNGNYIKAKQKVRQPKRSVSGFITDDSEELAESSSSQDDERIEQAQIRVQINDQKMTDIYSNSQCEILYDGVYYRGSIKNGHLNGNVEEKTQQYQFQGVFQMGERKKGRLVSKRGFEYEGTFKNNKFDGLGTLKTSDGVYSGQFKNGLKNGEGDFKWKDGSEYRGDFKNDLRHGKGYFKSLEGSFKGQWRNDQIQGSGYLVIGNQGVGGEWRKNSYEKPNKFF